MDFKLIFPGGYYLSTGEYSNLPVFDDTLSITDDNLDFYVVFADGRVYVATAFTVTNIARLLAKDGLYFWASDMFIVKDLARQTIRDAAQKSIDEGYFSLIFSFNGFVSDIFSDFISYEHIEE